MLDEPTIERLLMDRYRRQDPDEDPERIEQVAFAASGAADAEARRRAIDALSKDPTLAEAALLLGGLPPPKTARAPWRPLLAIAAAILIALLILDPFRSESELTPMGSVDRFSVGIEREGRRFLLFPGDRLVDGDRIGLFYSTDQRPTHLAALHRDRTGAVTVLFPIGERTSKRVEPGLDLALPDGAVAEAGAECEWFVAVFSGEPLPVAELERAVAGAKVRGCDLDRLQIRGARAVRIVPVKR